jgi:CDP-paratose 2-epimerase
MSHLVIGGFGFIGINLLKTLINKKKRVYVIDNLSRKGTKDLKKKINLDKEYDFFKVDIRNFNQVYKIFKKHKFKYIYLLAAQVAVTKSLQNPRLDFNTNALGTFNILEAMRLTKSKAKLIYSSTNKVYGKLENTKTKKTSNYYKFLNLHNGIDENFKLDFVTPYGCSKGAADMYCQDYYKSYSIKTVVMRQSCIYGSMQLGIEDQGWVAWIIIAAILNKKIKIFGDGLQARDVLFVDDLINLYLATMNSKKTIGKVYNIGGGRKNKISIIQLIQLLEIKLKKKIKYSYYRSRIGDQKVFISNNSKIYIDTKWKPTTSINRGLDKTILWIKENINLIKKINSR